jgi:hypothetical protein
MEALFLINTPMIEANRHMIHPPTTGAHQGSIQKAVLKKAITNRKALMIRGTNRILMGLYLTMKKQQMALTMLKIKKPKDPLIFSGSIRPSTITDIYTTTSATTVNNANTKLLNAALDKLFFCLFIIRWFNFDISYKII